MQSRRLTASMITALVIAFVLFPAPHATANEKIDGLTDAQMSFVNRMTVFMSNMDNRIFDRFARLNGGLELETAVASSESFDRDIKVTRGPVVEKAGRTISVPERSRPSDILVGVLALMCIRKRP